MPEATIEEFKRRSGFYSPKVIFPLCGVFVLLAWSISYYASQTENTTRFERAASSIVYAFKNRMTVYTNALVYTRNLMRLKPDLSHEEFQKFVREMKIKEEFPGIQNIGYVKRMNKHQVRKLLPTLPEGKRKMILDKDTYDMVIYIEQIVDSATSAIGFDLSTSKTRADAMTKAADLGIPVATDRVLRISDPNASPSEYYFIVFVPHYKDHMPINTPAERRAALQGFVYGGFRAPYLFGTIAGDTRIRLNQFVIQVFDGAQANPQNLIYSSGDHAHTDPKFYKEIDLNAAEHQWKIVLRALPEFAPAYSRYLPLLMLFMGTILTLGVVLSTRRTHKFARKLQEDILIRRQAEAQLSEEKQIVELTSKIGTTLKAEQDLASIVQLVINVATQVTGAKFGVFFYSTYTEQGSEQILHSLSGIEKSELAQLGVPQNPDVFRTTFEGSDVVRIDDLTQDSRFSKFPHPLGRSQDRSVRSYLSVPVKSKSGRILGALLFGHSEPCLFTPRSESLVRSLSIQAAVAMDNANLYRELSQARLAADSANRAKSLFLANVSHEIRTPLGLIVGFAELTAEHTDDPSIVSENIKKILRNGRELTRIIGEVLDLSKIEANALLIENSTFSLPQFLNELKSEWQPQIEAKKLKFEMNISSDLPLEMHTDSTRLTQILVNLLSNALKFTEHGRICMSITPENNSHLIVTVEDSGLGISDENKTQLFKTFSQGDKSIRRRYGGSGLGLALSKQLAHALGGDLKLIESQVSIGSIFTLRLPIRREDRTELAISGRSQGPRESLDSVRILLVEDSLDNQILMVRLNNSWVNLSLK
ncbi:MAG: CHASE domain-containing protein [Bdellovibrionaceae bacterium]|nr:CHASE domain-containing protein [Pseudobdellovibrionaceae bacterium]